METISRFILNTIRSLGPWAYAIIFLGPFLESSAFLGMLIPGETVMLFAGALCALGYLEIRLAFSLAAAGAILGDLLSFLLGHLVGRSYFEKREQFLKIRHEHIRRVDVFFEKHGGKTIFFGRFLTGFRSVGPFVAGMSKMRFHTFLLFNTTGALFWAAIFFSLGYLFGKNWQMIESWLQNLWYLLAIGLAAYLVYRYRGKLKKYWKEILRRRE
ncbi:MAG: DedA family protein [Deltaproteobacteria bacterium]|jgi:membrane protein DedA with SNARE-associated domain